VGTLTFPSGAKYAGELRDNNYNGSGVYLGTDGSKYFGEFQDGVRSGQGYIGVDKQKYFG